MDLKYDYWEGTFTEIHKILLRSISQYTRHYSKVKIGITNSPERRKREHHKTNHEWDMLVVKYRTSSNNFINKMEALCIEYQKEYVINQRNGGGGPNSEKGPYYLYLLLKK